MKYKQSFKNTLLATLLASCGSLAGYTTDVPCFSMGETCSTLRKSHLFFGAEALYWTVYQSNLDYAVDFHTEVNEILGPGTTHFLDYDWKPGGRAWFGWEWCNGWNATTVYTYYYNRAKGSVSTEGSDIGLKASLLHPSTGLANAEKAHGHNSITYQTVDFLIGRTVCLCDDTVTLHPYFGVRGLKLDEKLWITYEGDDFEDFPSRVIFDSDLQAIGLHAGLTSKYGWDCGFGFYGTFAGSLLATRTNTDHRQIVLDSDFDTFETVIDLKEREYIVIPALHLAAGLEWDFDWGSCITFRVKAGYEFNQYFNTPQLRRYHYGNDGVSSGSTSSNVTLHGGAVSFELYF